MINLSCPNCHQKPVERVDRMLRCTCGWWAVIDENIELKIRSIELATIVAS